MGEFLRSSYAKRYGKKYGPLCRRRFRQEHQWAVSVPGACEALCHWRSTVEELARTGVIEPVVAADLDMVNFFGSCEWSDIRDALGQDMPEIRAWTEWQQEDATATVLPSGEEFVTDRGAGQGDGFGTLQAAF